jgi:UDP-3-O-[3-hydroxymyristoyl] glucosamine N-acyltransferase
VWEVRDLEKIQGGVHLLASTDAFASRSGLSGISVKDPRAAFPVLLSLFQPVRKGRGVHPSAVISPGAVVSPDAWVGPLCVVEGGAVIGEGVRLRANVFVGEGCVLGAGTVVEPGAVLLEKVRTGKDCLIHGGAVLGSDGFGILPAGEVSGPVKIPQLGGVVLGDEVEIGACTTVDRGTLDDTVVGDFTKVDDHVHIAHNTVIGKNCIVVAMTGIAGSAVLEDNVVMAARSGVKDHTRIGRGATVAANAGAIKDVPPGAVVSGFPARDHRENFRVQAAQQRLPELLLRVRKLEQAVFPSDEKLPDRKQGGEGH